MNGFDASVSGRSMLAGLQQVPVGGSDVWVISLGLDTADPVDARLLGFDVPISEVVDQLTRAGELPRTLAGRTVWFVWSQPAGPQQTLRQLAAALEDSDPLKVRAGALLGQLG